LLQRKELAFCGDQAPQVQPTLMFVPQVNLIIDLFGHQDTPTEEPDPRALGAKSIFQSSKRSFTLVARSSQAQR
jgi:hypothetical protein